MLPHQNTPQPRQALMPQLRIACPLAPARRLTWPAAPSRIQKRTIPVLPTQITVPPLVAPAFQLTCTITLILTPKLLPVQPSPHPIYLRSYPPFQLGRWHTYRRKKITRVAMPARNTNAPLVREHSPERTISRRTWLHTTPTDSSPTSVPTAPAAARSVASTISDATLLASTATSPNARSPFAPLTTPRGPRSLLALNRERADGVTAAERVSSATQSTATAPRSNTSSSRYFFRAYVTIQPAPQLSGSLRSLAQPRICVPPCVIRCVTYRTALSSVLGPATNVISI